VSNPHCRHHHAWPTIYFNQLGLMWCPDCGARRDIVCGEGNGFIYAPGSLWIYPRGQAAVIRRLNLEAARKASL
jgi:hypothetical protein